jgi:hypothetical protein
LICSIVHFKIVLDYLNVEIGAAARKRPMSCICILRMGCDEADAPRSAFK